MRVTYNTNNRGNECNGPVTLSEFSNFRIGANPDFFKRSIHSEIMIFLIREMLLDH